MLYCYTAKIIYCYLLCVYFTGSQPFCQPQVNSRSVWKSVESCGFVWNFSCDPGATVRNLANRGEGLSPNTPPPFSAIFSMFPLKSLLFTLCFLSFRMVITVFSPALILWSTGPAQRGFLLIRYSGVFTVLSHYV